MGERTCTAAEENARRNLDHLDELALAVCRLRDRTYTRRRFLEEAARLADRYNIDRINERRATTRHPVKLHVFLCPVYGVWIVSFARKARYLMGFGRVLATYPTHRQAFADAWARTHPKEAPDGR